MDATAEVLRHLSSHQKADETLVKRVPRKINGDDNEHDDDRGGPATRLTEALLGHEPDYHQKGWWGSYIRRRMKRAAASQLWSMSDRELKDIGLSRSQIMGGVTGELACNRAFSRYY